ncbi:MAG TPA: hypothetical protein ENI14_02115 [Thermoplasmatales archaeon]|nr:hypothetical protein [Thermoplasmatales archaeon]
MRISKGIVLLIISSFLLLSLSGCLELRVAYIPDNLLTNGWHENVEKEESGSSYFGLEKWNILVYENGDVSALTITTIKTLIMMDKEELLKKIDSDIRNTCGDYGITIEGQSKVSGSRMLVNGHESRYVIYNGTKNSEDYKIIGEVWSCSYSGISVMCIGMAKISDIKGLESWREIAGDPYGSIEGIKGEGLIYNINCH